MNFFMLDKDWELRYEDIYWGKEYFAEVIDKKEGWHKVHSLPCDVHMPLIENGIIEDPMIADNHLNCRWIEDKSWWFRKIFEADEKLIDSNISELVLGGLDVKADIFLNGKYIGHHASAMYPFRKDVKDLFNKGENILLIRVTSGLEYYSDLDVAKIKDYISCEYKRGRGPRGDNRRALVRKPQYVYGWDWTPRIATCGIMGRARIEAYKEIVVRDIRFVTERLLDEKAQVMVEVEIENSTPISTINADIKLDLCYKEETVQSETRQVFLTSGLNFVKFDLTIEEPKLWWPNGMGMQNMYDLGVQASLKGKLLDYKKIKTGIRTIKLNTERIDDLNRSFLFEINGIKTFCKGANWETPETIYARTSDEKYETLVREAKKQTLICFV